LAHRRGLVVAVALAGSVGFLLFGPVPKSVRAEVSTLEGFKKEFEEVCSGTQNAMVLSTVELRTLLERCDRLRSLLPALNEPERKIYSKRVAACCNVYSFVLETRT